MSTEERRQILRMVEEGRITAEEALNLIRELEQEGGEQAPSDLLEEGGAEEEAAQPAEPGLERTTASLRRLWQVPLWAGMALTVLAAVGINAAMQGAGYNFWFYCLWLPFLLGIGLMALAAWSRTARWLFVNVGRPRSSGGTGRIFLGFPLPLGLAGWFLRTFGGFIHGLEHSTVEQVVQAMARMDSIDEPLVVDVDEGDGERVQVYISREAK